MKKDSEKMKMLEEHNRITFIECNSAEITLFSFSQGVLNNNHIFVINYIHKIQKLKYVFWPPFI